MYIHRKILITTLSDLKSQFETLKQNLKNEGIPFRNSNEYYRLHKAVSRCKKKVEVEETFLSENLLNLEKIPFPSKLIKKRNRIETPGFVNVNNQKLRSLEDKLIFLRPSLKNKGVFCRDSKEYRIIKNAIRRLEVKIDPLFFDQKRMKKLVIKLRTLEFRFEMLKQTLKNEGVSFRNSKEYYNLYHSVSRRKKRIATENLCTIQEIIFL